MNEPPLWANGGARLHPFWSPKWQHAGGQIGSATPVLPEMVSATPKGPWWWFSHP
jgi:hypothetical protein